MSRARIEPIADFAAFCGRLASAPGAWTVLVETLREFAVHRDVRGADAASLVATLHERAAEGLHVRAFQDVTELAWFGSAGLAVVADEAGEFEVVEATVQDGSGRRAGVRRLLVDGRIVFEGLRYIGGV